MRDELTIADVDHDGAIAEAHDGLATTRGQLFRRAGLIAGGGLVAAGVPIAFAGAQGGGLSKGDVKILNYALTLEYLEAAFYAEANAKGKLNGIAATFAQVVGAHEAAHVAALEKALGSQAVKKPSFDFKGTTGSEKTFLATAGSILAVEARHAAWVRDILGAGKDPVPAPEAFSTPKSMSQVLTAVKSTGFLKA